MLRPAGLELGPASVSLVRVAAKTAPALPGSVPKSARPGHYLSEGPGARPMQLAGRRLGPDEQVLLLVQDQMEGSPVMPVIGRRLPSKSAKAFYEATQAFPAHEPSIPFEQRTNPAVPPSMAPLVLGRRSHRAQQHGHHLHKDQLFPDLQSDRARWNKSQEIWFGQEEEEQRLQREKQYRTGAYPAFGQTGQQPNCSASSRRPHNRPSRSHRERDKLFDIPVDQLQISSQNHMIPTGRHSHEHFGAGSHPIGSSSYMSLCPNEQDETLLTPSCCQPHQGIPKQAGRRRFREASRSRQHSGQAASPEAELIRTCRSLSCQRLPTCCAAASNESPSKANNKRTHRRHQQVHGLETSKSRAPAAPMATPATHRERHSSCHAKGPSNPSDYADSRLESPRNQSNSHLSHHEPMVISGRSLMPVCVKPAGYSLQQATPGVAKHSQRQPGAPDTRHLCPVKKNNQAKDRQQAPTGTAAVPSTPEPSATVTQMYESLAAELKAKLGDPRLAPILLPPKDYDTISRRQGKLTGIELRRSTNPQLIGPTASGRSNNPAQESTASHRDRDQQEKIAHNGQIDCPSAHSPITCKLIESDQASQVVVVVAQPASCDSARSSGRGSQDERSPNCSRSNSSSGLGSICVGAGSPDSGQSSAKCTGSPGSNKHLNDNDSDSYRRTESSMKSSALTRHQLTSGNQVQTDRLSRVYRKSNCSPDNLSGSDSGHSDFNTSCTNSNNNNMYSHEKTRVDIGQSNKGGQVDASAKFVLDETPVSRYKSKLALAAESRQRGKGVHNHNHNPGNVSNGVLWNGRVEIPLKVNSAKDGNTYLATKQIIY